MQGDWISEDGYRCSERAEVRPHVKSFSMGNIEERESRSVWDSARKAQDTTTPNPCSLLELRIYTPVNFNFEGTSTICSQIWVKICQVVNHSNVLLSSINLTTPTRQTWIVSEAFHSYIFQDSAQISGHRTSISSSSFVWLQNCFSQQSSGTEKKLQTRLVRIFKILKTKV